MTLDLYSKCLFFIYLYPGVVLNRSNLYNAVPHLPQTEQLDVGPSFSQQPHLKALNLQVQKVTSPLRFQMRKSVVANCVLTFSYAVSQPN